MRIHAAVIAAILYSVSSLLHASEKELVVQAVRDISGAIEKGKSLSSIENMPAISAETQEQLLKLKRCQGSASDESTLSKVTLQYRCGSVRMGRTAVSMPDAAAVDLLFESGVLKSLNYRVVKGSIVPAENISEKYSAREIVARISAGEPLPEAILDRQIGLKYPDLDQALAQAKGCIADLIPVQNGNFAVEWRCKGRKRKDMPSGMIFNTRNGTVIKITTAVLIYRQG